jgi:hypothetical protein
MFAGKRVLIGFGMAGLKNEKIIIQFLNLCAKNRAYETLTIALQGL